MLRFFRLYKTVSYDTNNVFEALFRKTSSKTRVLIFNMLAFALTAGRIQKHELQALQVGSKPYLYGDPTNLALIATSPFEVVDGLTNPAMLSPGHFPGSLPLLENGGRCGVIPVPGGEQVKATIKMMVANSALTHLALECCQLPDEGESAEFDALWDRLTRDVGNVVFYGNKKAYTDVLADNRFTATVRDAAVRRYTPRGIVVTDSTYALDATEYLAATARVQANAKHGNPHSDLAEPVALIFGHAGFNNHSKFTIDLSKFDESQIDLSSPAASGTARTWYTLTPMEGREKDAAIEYGGPAAY
jgi:hypothetical protein